MRIVVIALACIICVAVGVTTWLLLHRGPSVGCHDNSSSAYCAEDHVDPMWRANASVAQQLKCERMICESSLWNGCMDTPGRFVAWSTCVLDLCRTYDIGTWCYINTDWGPLCQQEWMGDARIERASPQVQSHWKNLLLQRVTSHADADDASGVTLLVGQDNFADVRAYASAFGSNRISGLSGYSQLWSNKDVQKPQFQGDNCCAEGAYDVNQNRGNKTCYENCSQESERRYRDGTLARGLQNFDWSACNLHATPTTEQFGLLETMLDDTRYNGGRYSNWLLDW